MGNDQLIELLSRLVAIDSVNPDLIAGAAGEAEIARFVSEWLEAAGLEVEVFDAAPRRPNVVATARGSGGGRSLMLNAHLDTVGVAGMERPHEPYVEDGRLYGRGAYDMKSGLATIMIAAAEASRKPLRGDVIVTAVADEELGSVGTEAVAARYEADAAIVVEPTELQVGVAHRGFVAFRIETVGRAAHGSRPELGIDAIAKMGRIAVELEALDRSLRAEPTHRLLGSGSLHASLIEGGQELSSYPAECLLTGERRTIPGETTAQVEEELRAVLERARAADAEVDAGVELLFGREPFEVAEDEPIVELVCRRSGSPVVGLGFWADSGLLSAAGIPTVLFGPAGEGAHAAVEWVDLESVGRCLDVVLSVAVEWCG